MLRRAFTLVLLAGSVGVSSACPAIAAPSPVNLFAESSPHKGDARTKPLDSITLTFAKPVEIVSVSIILPDESEQSVVAAIYAPGAKNAKGKSFAFSLSPPLSTSGSYKISYLVTARGVRSLNGFIDFEIVK